MYMYNESTGQGQKPRLGDASLILRYRKTRSFWLRQGLDWLKPAGRV